MKLEKVYSVEFMKYCDAMKSNVSNKSEDCNVEQVAKTTYIDTAEPFPVKNLIWNCYKEMVVDIVQLNLLTCYLLQK